MSNSTSSLCATLSDYARNWNDCPKRRVCDDQPENSAISRKRPSGDGLVFYDSSRPDPFVVAPIGIEKMPRSS